MSFRLPVLQDSFDRRQALLLGVAAGAAACAPANFGFIDEALPHDGGDDAATEPDLDAGTETPDVGSPPRDTGVALRDTGVVPPRDTGVVPPRDTGVVPTPDVPPACTPRGTRFGAVGALAVGAYQLIGSRSTTVIVGRDAGGYFAFSGVCPHQGCALPVPTSNNITCPCHRARFDGNGALTAGPARTSLPHREVTVCDGVVYIGTATVDAATRTPV